MSLRNKLLSPLIAMGEIKQLKAFEEMVGV